MFFAEICMILYCVFIDSATLYKIIANTTKFQQKLTEQRWNNGNEHKEALIHHLERQENEKGSLSWPQRVQN